MLCAQGSAPSHRADGTWLTDWLVLDSYLSGAEQTRFLAEFPTHKAGFPEEKDVWLAPGGQTRAWRRVRVGGDFFNVRAAVGRDYQGKSAFLFSQLTADRPGNVEFRLSARPEVTLWLNGRELPRARYLYDDLYKGKGTWILEGQLEAGTNGLLLQVSQLGLDRGLALRVSPAERTVFTGRVLDTAGKAILQDVRVAAFQEGKELTRIRTDNSGIYHLSLVAAPDKPCDIAFTYGDTGCWWLGRTLRPGERLIRDVTLHPAVSLAGTLAMLDKARSPHREVAVQALRDGVVAASVLSDEKGHYQFVNLKPGHYQVRCQTPAGHRYYAPARPQAETAPLTPRDSPTLLVEEGNAVRNLDFRFAAFKKGFWKRYDSFDGVPNNRVLSLALAPSGELWLQTASGLGCFDGQRFTTVAGTETKPITGLAVAPNGAVWFGTYAGLFRLERGALTAFTVTNGLPDDLITCLCAARSGEIWIGTEYGLAAFDGRQFRAYTIANGLVQDHITVLGETPDGAIWAGTSGGLSRYDGRQFLNFTTAEGLTGNEVTALDCASAERVRVAARNGIASGNARGFTPLYGEAEQEPRWFHAIHTGADGRLWLGTEWGLSIFDGQNMVHTHPDEGLGGGNVSAIVATAEGLLWFATDNGVARLDPGFAIYTSKDGLADNRVFDLSLDAGTLWYGMEWGGLGRFDGKDFTTVLPNRYARKLHRAADGVLWVGTDKGALRHTGAGFLPGGLLEDRWIMAIASDPQGALWFGSGWSGGGLARAQTNAQGAFALKSYTRENGLPNPEVNDILCLAGGVTWLGTAAGASRFDGRNFQNFTVKDGLPDNVVRTVRQGKDGALWLGTDGGVARYDGRAFRNITAAFGLPVSRVFAVYPARDGLLWFGTETHGACAFDGRAFATLDSRDGLVDNRISAIAEDPEGNLWFSSFRGGLTRYRRKSASPQVRLTEVKMGGKVMPATGSPPRLRAGEPAVFSYEALDWLTPPHKRQYRIALRPASAVPGAPAESLDLVTRKTEFDWTPERTGDYTLDIQAINLNLVYSPPVRLAFSVFLPWYERAAWRATGGLAGASVLFAAVWLAYANWAQRREARRLKDLMLAREQSARATLEDKNHQLEQRAIELKEHQQRLEEALANVKTLRGLVPICAACKKIRDDNGFWQQLESFVQEHSEAQFSHGMCPDCIKKWYPNIHPD